MVGNIDGIKVGHVPYNLGIDIGSTSTNLVLIDDEKNVIAFRYLRTKGNPRQVVQEGINSLQEEFEHSLKIKGMGTTGSGRYLIGNELGAVLIVDEITAQAKGAVEADPEVDTVFEIGGLRIIPICIGPSDNIFGSYVYCCFHSDQKDIRQNNRPVVCSLYGRSQLHL